MRTSLTRSEKQVSTLHPCLILYLDSKVLKIQRFFAFCVVLSEHHSQHFALGFRIHSILMLSLDCFFQVLLVAFLPFGQLILLLEVLLIVFSLSYWANAVC